MHEALAARVRGYILHHRLIASGDTIVVAVSGGPDSLCLLHVLHGLSPELGCRLHVAHLDHGLRDASEHDAAFVAGYAGELSLPCTVERRDVPALARARRLSLEAAARVARYTFLRAVAAAGAAAAIATGHTRDDQAETLLLHLVRGSGLNGLAGLRPRNRDVIHPFLEVSHAEAAAYCVALSLSPREDASNRSMAFTRNRLRRDVMPRLDAIHPAASSNIAKAARLIAGDLALVERWAARALDRALIERHNDGAALSSSRWAESDAELRPHMLRLLLVRLLGHAEDFDERHYTAMLRALAPQAPRTSLSLPKGLTLTRRGDEAVLAQGAAPAAAPLGAYRLTVPGNVVTPAGTMRAVASAAPRDWADASPMVAYLNPDAAGADLTMRAWRHGDRMRPLGMNGTRKVQDIFVDRKVPRSWRYRIPIVEGPRGIAWVAGLCIGDSYRAAPGTPAVRLVWEEAPSPCNDLP